MAYSFNGTNQYFSIDSAVAQGVPVTMSCWFYTNDQSRIDRMVSVGQSNPTVGHRHALGRTSNNLATAFDRGRDSTTDVNRVANTTTQISFGVWEHYTSVFGSLTSRSIYLNGSNSVNTTSSLTSFNTFTRTTYIGANNTGGSISSFTSGLIAEVGIWNVSLTDAEILSLSKGFACKKIRPQSLVLYVPMTRDLNDLKESVSITNNNTATVANHPKIYY